MEMDREVAISYTTPLGVATFTSTEVVYGVADPDVTALPEYGVSP